MEIEGNSGTSGMLNFMTPGSGAVKPLSLEAHEAWTRRVSQAGCLVEPWRCDLSSGAFVVGSRTLAVLGLRRNPLRDHRPRKGL
ncbi:hypothetical protein ACVJMZ_001937 [Sinorhizobium medicae]